MLLLIVLNYIIIIINDNEMDIIFDFVALAIINQIDDFYYIVHSDGVLGAEIVANENGMFDPILNRSVTTSRDAD